MPESAFEPPIPWIEIFTQAGIALLASGMHPGDPHLDRAALPQLCGRQRNRDRDDNRRVGIARIRLDGILPLVDASYRAVQLL